MSFERAGLQLEWNLWVAAWKRQLRTATEFDAEGTRKEEILKISYGEQGLRGTMSVSFEREESRA